jgi:pilus assembly protein TadC
MINMTKFELPCHLCRWPILQALPLFLGIFPCASLILTWFLALNVLGSMHVLADFGSSLIDSLGLLGLAMGLVGVRIIQTCVPNP